MPDKYDIVKFVNPITEAAQFCMKHGITGVIISVQDGLFEINTGFYYTIFARSHEIAIVVSRSEVPIPEDL